MKTKYVYILYQIIDMRAEVGDTEFVHSVYSTLKKAETQKVYWKKLYNNRAEQNYGFKIHKQVLL